MSALTPSSLSAYNFAAVEDQIDRFLTVAAPDVPRDTAPLGTATDGILNLIGQAQDTATRGDREGAAELVMYAAGNAVMLHAFVVREHMDEMERAFTAQIEQTSCGSYRSPVAPHLTLLNRAKDRAAKIESALWDLAEALDPATFARLFRGRVQNTADAPARADAIGVVGEDQP